MQTNISNETREIFVTGLRNAHAMESQALSIMKPQVKRIENYPEVARRLEQHIGETEGQMSRLESLLGSFDTSHSSMKDMALSMAGGMAALGHSMAGDEILKNSFANYAFEHYEIAAYKSLIAMAETAGIQNTLPVLKQNLAEEEAMANWLDEHLRSVTLQFASLKEVGASAKI